MRGLKGSLYEGGVRVPTLVRWPGHVAAGSTSDYVSGFEDWLPTLMDILGKEKAIPEGVSGISIKPTLLGQSQPVRPYLYREFPSYGGQQTLRVGDFKAVRQNMNKGNLEIELYNIAEDISESNDLASQYPEMVASMAKQMEQVRTPSKISPLIPIDAPVRGSKK